MRGLPIRWRLTLAFALAMALLLTGIGLVVYLRVGTALQASVDQTLRALGKEAVKPRADERRLVDPDVAGGLTLAERLDPAGRVVRSSPAGLSPLLSRSEIASVLRDGPTLATIGLRNPGGQWRVLALRSGVGPTATVVAVARSLGPREETLDRLLRELLLAGPAGLLLASLLGYGLAAGALRPVEAMRRRATGVSASEPGRRLPVPSGRDELARLAETLNEMLERLEGAFAHERQFVADASHELRTPLALLQTEIDLALRRPRSADELEHALRSAAEETTRLNRLADDLLLITRADHHTLPITQERVPARELLETVAARYSSRADVLGRQLRTDAPDDLLDVDPARIEQALGNLVSNALEHGDGPIELTARTTATSVELHVLDEGAGFPAGFIERAFDRFTRADEARRGEGAGLGLAIVKVIAEAHDGTASAANRATGSDVWIALPRKGEQPSPARSRPG